MDKCKIEFEDLEAWKKWFDTGNKDELVNALNFMQRSITRVLPEGIDYAKARRPYIKYAVKKMNKRFDDWDADYIPF